MQITQAAGYKLLMRPSQMQSVKGNVWLAYHWDTNFNRRAVNFGQSIE